MTHPLGRGRNRQSRLQEFHTTVAEQSAWDNVLTMTAAGMAPTRGQKGVRHEALEGSGVSSIAIEQAFLEVSSELHKSS
jgi:hypothetical protein